VQPNFSNQIIQEYIKAAQKLYGFTVSQDVARSDLATLTRSLFTSNLVEPTSESREFSASTDDLSSACTDSLSEKIATDENDKSRA